MIRILQSILSRETIVFLAALFGFVLQTVLYVMAFLGLILAALHLLGGATSGL